MILNYLFFSKDGIKRSRGNLHDQHLIASLLLASMFYSSSTLFAAPASRVWTSGNYKVDGVFLGFKDGKVQIKNLKNGKSSEVALEKFSQQDQEYVSKMVNSEMSPSTSAPVVPPEVSADDAYNRGLKFLDSNMPDEAEVWFQKAAKQGHTEANYNIGLIYMNGRGKPQDSKKALEWFQKAADQGFLAAQYDIGIMYMNGNGVPQDYKVALEWFQKAAKQGAAPALNAIGMMYMNGTGVSQDYSTAMRWFQDAQNHGFFGASHNIEIVCMRMNEDLRKRAMQDAHQNTTLISQSISTIPYTMNNCNFNSGIDPRDMANGGFCFTPQLLNPTGINLHAFDQFQQSAEFRPLSQFNSMTQPSGVMHPKQFKSTFP
jgi:tetratricopeptide (TPR) repeat protein